MRRIHAFIERLSVIWSALKPISLARLVVATVFGIGVGVAVVWVPLLDPIRTKLLGPIDPNDIPDEVKARTSCRPSNYKAPITTKELDDALKKHSQWLGEVMASSGTGLSVDGIRRAIDSGKTEGRAVLCNRNFSRLILENLNVVAVDFSFSIFSRADLTDAQLVQSVFIGSCFIKTKMTKFIGFGSTFQLSTFYRADLTDSSLVSTDLRGVEFLQSDLKDASVRGADLTNLVYSPKTDPTLDFSGTSGLPTMTYPIREGDLRPGSLLHIERYAGKVDYCWRSYLSSEYEGGVYREDQTRSGPGALVRLRKALQDAGMRGYERAITHAIETTQTQYQLSQSTIFDVLDGWMRFVLFDLTTSYGYVPGRALRILLAVILACSLVYFVQIAFLKTTDTKGIFRILPKDRFVSKGRGFKFLDQKVQRVQLPWKKAYPYALYFSTMSAFQIGWKDFNVGNWLARVQTREYTLAAKGWIRVIAGLQTIVCLYLLAIWALTYFSRPFEQ